MPKVAASPEAQLRNFIAKFDTQNQALIRSTRRALRKRFPTATELVYDNYNFFVIGYSPSERPSDAVVSIAAAKNGVGVCFIHGAKLHDPTKLLNGSGKQTRFLRVPVASVLSRPDVEKLFAQAIANSNAEFPHCGKGRLVIRSISAKQRPRR